MLCITGGCGFIGSNFVHHYLTNTQDSLLNIDALTYSGNPDNLSAYAHDPRYQFAHADIGNKEAILALLQHHQPSKIVHFAAESHVDRSITQPDVFLQTNVMGTHALLQAALSYYRNLDKARQQNFVFLHISTDEVYGSLGLHDTPFTEQTAYAPNSPYAASKAASDHLVRSYGVTFKLPVMISNCSNNYGPYQYPEKLIPLMIDQALQNKPLPVYGSGLNIRDWLHVQDHCSAIMCILQHGKTGEKYNIGGHEEHSNLDVVQTICAILQAKCPQPPGAKPYRDLIEFVTDRAGHDFRYAINSSKMQAQFGWQPQYSFTDGLAMTVDWYLNHPEWLAKVKKNQMLAAV